MQTTSLYLEKEKLEKAAYILKTIGHPIRLAVVSILNEKDRLSVNEMCEELACEQSLLSHHLTNMRIKGLLKAEKEGQNVYYSLREKNLAGIIDCIAKCDCNM